MVYTKTFLESLNACQGVVEARLRRPMRFIINHKQKLWLDAQKATEVLSKISGNGVVWSKCI